MRGLILIRLILWEFMNHVTLTDLYHYTEGNSIQLFGSISHLQLNNYVNANTMTLKTLMRS